MQGTLLSDICRYIINFSTYANHQYPGSLVCTFRWSVCAITVCHWSKLDCLQGQRSRILLQSVHYVSMVSSVCHSFETRLFVCIVDTVIQEVYLNISWVTALSFLVDSITALQQFEHIASNLTDLSIILRNFIYSYGYTIFQLFIRIVETVVFFTECH